LVQPELYRVLDFRESPRQLAQHFEPEVRSCADGGFGSFWVQWVLRLRLVLAVMAEVAGGGAGL
jgi:hypothetical protein